MRALGSAIVVLATVLAGCFPDLGPCDEARARAVVFTDDTLGSPAYEGQALMLRSCGNGAFCHASSADAVRFGAPAILDFDLRLAEDPGEIERLRESQLRVYRYRYHVLRAVRGGSMPPGGAGAEVEEIGPLFAGLPELGSREGREILRNWLACGSPVVERTSYPRPAGIDPVGAVVAPRPAGVACRADETYCRGYCVDLATSASHCGRCDLACAAGEVCVAGACACAPSLDACPGVGCVDLGGDGSHCGDCTTACNPGSVCASGSCSTGSCPVGESACGTSCADFQTDVLACGGCDQACAPGEACSAGACTCGDTSSDPLDCGACGNVCPPGAACVAGLCDCGIGLTACASTCVDVVHDPLHCGSCTNVCGNGERCENGSCVACGGGTRFARDVQPIFSENCATSRCHTGARPAGGLRLDSAAASYDGLVGVVARDCGDGRFRVEPYFPTRSYLIDKLEGLDLCRGQQMPLLGGIDAAEFGAISDWICGGARDD